METPLSFRVDDVIAYLIPTVLKQTVHPV